MTRESTAPARVRRVRPGRSEDGEDVVATEEPLEIRVVERTDGEREHALAVTMRTPGNDIELAAGFLYSEGLLLRPADVDRIEHATPRSAEEQGNVVRVVLRRGIALDLSKTVRSFYTSSACGVCGKESLDAIWSREPPKLPTNSPRVAAKTLTTLPEVLRREQTVFARTGGLHAAALFHADGMLVTLREDVGRHNAVDKAIGERFLKDALPLGDHVMLVSGRASFEILQKAVLAGIPFIAAVGAPSSLAVDVAREFGVTLVGFLRGDTFNVYSGNRRIG